MKLTLLSHKEISTLYLPEKCAGRYWLRSRNDDGKQLDIISVEALRTIKADEEDKWLIKSNRRFVIVHTDDKVIQSTPLNLLALYKIQSVDKKTFYTFYGTVHIEQKAVHRI